MRNNYSHNKQAFSLFELSIAVLIIGLLISAIVATSIIISKARISTAISLTNSSPVNSVPNLSMWLEASDDTSFLDTETYSGNTVSIWYDKNKSGFTKTNATQVTNANKPTYSNAINNIYSIKFDGTSDFLNVNGSILNNTNYTIFVVDKRLSNKIDNYFIGDSSNTTNNQTLILGYNTNTGVIHSQGTSNSYTSSITGYVGDKNEPKIFSFIHNSSSGKKTYINGMLTGQSNNTSNLTNISTLKIGNAYNGEIGEIIIFDRALKDEERNSIENYLSKKWQVKTYAGTSCTTGSATYQGCDLSTCSVAVTGSLTTSVSSGTTSTIPCNATGYSGTVSYTCTNGSLSTSGSCSCASGYSASGGSCQANCSVTGIAGVTNTTVNNGSSTLTCNQSNFTGSISYTCSNGTFTPSGSCSCAAGYTLSGGTCNAITCSFSGTAGVTNGTSVNYTTSTLTQNCNASGYAGTVSYTCTGSGTLSVSANNCIVGCGNINNGAGGTFDATGLGNNSQYALKACESVYGVGQCSSANCGNFTYWYKTSQGSCNCSKAIGSYEFIYNNTGYTQVGQDYAGGSADVTNDKLFVRIKGSAGCYSTAWILNHKTLASGCAGATD